ncbi:CACTA en-spm transposon protein [Cucumis melo var. makuwa]|uniref:CACTA en-spm transposon protein n=1 Tax=Cucumis melo var. makuwa TaxID=1194695 RepID=A0A5D3E6F1_CUCMM|nr:CACTA en-spm transposon protein [Cucumis melo var. makuwa]
MLVSQATENAHIQMLELQFQPILEGTQPLSRDEICEKSTVELQLQAKLDQAMQWIEEQTKNHYALTSKVERIRKIIKDMSRAQQGPPHDP